VTETKLSELIGEVFDASTLIPKTDGTLVLPGWMAIACETAERSAQTSASTAKTGFAAHAARAFSRDGSAWGLLVEPAATNRIGAQGFASWTPVGTPILSAATTPAGTSEGVNIEDDDGAAIEMETYALADLSAAAWSLSVWIQAIGAVSSVAQLQINGTTPSLAAASGVAADADWVLRTDSETLAVFAGLSARAIPRSTAAHVGSARFWGMQLEERDYPTSFIGSDNATFSRLADTVRAAAEAIAPGGFFSLELRYRPHYAEDEAATDHNLLWFDADNRAYYRASDDKFVLEIEGAIVASSAVTFNRHQELTLTLAHTFTGRTLTVAGATTGDGTTTGAALDAIVLPCVAFVLGTVAGAEHGADLTALIPDLITFPEYADSRALVQMDDTAGNRDFRDFLRVLAEQAGRFRDAGLLAKASFDLASAAGDQLDAVGSSVGLAREGWLDSRYRVFLEIQTELMLSSSRGDAEWGGTCENILRIARKHVGPDASAITLTNYPPYSYLLQVPDLDLAEGGLLARFLATANYAAVLGMLIVLIAEGSRWESDVVPLAQGGTWESAVAPIAGAAKWQIVVTT